MIQIIAVAFLNEVCVPCPLSRALQEADYIYIHKTCFRSAPHLSNREYMFKNDSLLKAKEA